MVLKLKEQFLISTSDLVCLDQNYPHLQKMVKMAKFCVRCKISGKTVKEHPNIFGALERGRNDLYEYLKTSR